MGFLLLYIVGVSVVCIAVLQRLDARIVKRADANREAWAKFHRKMPALQDGAVPVPAELPEYAAWNSKFLN